MSPEGGELHVEGDGGIVGVVDGREHVLEIDNEIAVFPSILNPDSGPIWSWLP